MDPATARFDFTARVLEVDELGRLHFIAIGGSGMSAVARVMLARGAVVAGSDAKESEALDALRELGATCWVGHDPAHLAGADTVVVSSAITEDNVELAAARAAGLRVLHRAQALASAMQSSRRVAVAGANGKTTTTSMVTVALQHCGADPSFASGSELATTGTNAAWGGGAVFVAEADESDGSFLVYRPEVAVVTNVQPDHLDFYGTFERVQEAYAAFAATVLPGGLLVACWDDPGSRALTVRVRRAGGRVLTYGTEEEADLVVVSSAAEGLGSRSVLRRGDGTLLELILRVPGVHNVLNACAAYLTATEGLGEQSERVLAGLAAYTGARRRFEVRGEVRGVTVVDDYAHNPGKVAAVVSTAAAAVRQRGARLHVAFQPHLYSRTRDFADGFARGLVPADTVVLLDVYGAREQPFGGITSELVAAPLRGLSGEREVHVGLGFEEAAALLARVAAAGDLVLTVGAGDVTTLAPRVLALLGGSS